MRALLLLSLRRSAEAWALGLGLFLLITFGLHRIFRISSENMWPWALLAGLTGFIYFVNKTSQYTYRVADQWPLLLPERRHRMVLAGYLYSFFCSWLVGLYMFTCSLIFVWAFIPGPFGDITFKDSDSKDLHEFLHNIESSILIARSPVPTSFFGMALIAVFGILAFGNSRFAGFRALQGNTQFASRPKLTWRDRLKGIVVLTAISMVIAVLYRASSLIPWACLAAFAFLYRHMLGTIYALSRSESLRFSMLLVRGPAIGFFLYFFGMLLYQSHSPKVERREMASIYSHSLVGQNLITDRRLKQLADPESDLTVLGAIRDEYHGATGSWYYGKNLPVSFADVVKDHTGAYSLDYATAGFDHLYLTDDDARAYARALEKSFAMFGNRHPDSRPWDRFHPSEALTLELLGSSAANVRGFGAYIAINAPNSIRIQNALTREAKDPAISDQDLMSLAESLSVQLRRHVTVAWAVHATPESLAHDRAPAFDCAQFRVFSWKDFAEDPNYEAASNTCLRDFASRLPQAPDEKYIHPTFSRRWISRVEGPAHRSTFNEWKRCTSSPIPLAGCPEM